MKSQKIKSQKLHVPILETNRKNLHPQKKPVIRYLNDVLHQNLTYQRYKQTFCHYGQLTTNKTSGLIVLHVSLQLWLPPS